MSGPEAEDAKARAERTERLKETVAEFGKFIQGHNWLGKHINLIIYMPVIVYAKIGQLEQEYSNVCYELAKIYNHISDLTLGNTPDNVVKKFEKIDPDSQQLLATIEFKGKRIMKCLNRRDLILPNSRMYQNCVLMV